MSSGLGRGLRGLADALTIATNGASISLRPSVIAVVVFGLTMRIGSEEAISELEERIVSSASTGAE